MNLPLPGKGKNWCFADKIILEYNYMGPLAKCLGPGTISEYYRLFLRRI
jgi:hypothetical protein